MSEPGSRNRFLSGRWALAGVATLLIGVIPAAAAVQTLSVAVPGDASTAGPGAAVPVDPEVRLGEFPNGFRYYVRENREPENRAELRLVVNAGSVLEDPDQLGLAHFLEHMAFNGTANFEKQELISFMESIGMRLGPGVNASTSFDETIYQIRVPTDDEVAVDTAFRILEDWAHRLTLDPDEIDQERGVVIEEWRGGQGAGSRLRDRQFPIIFRGSQYAARLPIGTLESLRTFEHDALRRFYTDWYRPDLMAVVAVGDFDADRIETLLARHFESLPLPASPRERPSYGIPDHEETLFSIATDPELGSTSVSVYHMMEPETDWTIGGYRERLVGQLYNSMLNDRFQEIARQPNPPFVGAQSAQGRLIRSKGAYALSASVLEGGVERGLEAIFVEAERVAQFGFTASELEREKTRVLRNMERQYANRANRSSSAFASEYIRAYLDGESIPGMEYEWALYQRFVPEITLGEVNRVGRDWIRDANRVVLVTGPDKDGLEFPGEAALNEVLANVETVEIAPYVDAVSDAVLLAEVPEGSPLVETRERDQGIREWRLANGIRVVLKPTDFDEDQIVFQGFSPGGTSLADDADWVVASTATQLVMQGGLGEFDSTELEKMLAGRIANASPFISDFEEGVSGSASPADLETLFQLIYLRFTQPRADDTYFELWQTRLAQQLANRDLNPSTALSDAYIRLMTGDHPRERPMTLERLGETDLYESLAFYQDRFRDAGDFTFVFVGDIDPDEMRPLVETYLGGLPASGREETWRDTGVRTPRGVYEETVSRGLAPQSQTVVAFTGPFDYESQAERTGIRALAMILQSRLQDLVREELGGTYGVGVSPSTRWRPNTEYQMTIQFGSDPERAAELTGIVFDAIEAFRAEGPTPTEVAEAQEALRRQFETDFQENRTWLSQLVSDYQRGVEPASAVPTFPASVDALTPDWIRDAASRYLDQQNYVRVTLVPESTP
jgi:zinc protease